MTQLSVLSVLNLYEVVSPLVYAPMPFMFLILSLTQVVLQDIFVFSQASLSPLPLVKFLLNWHFFLLIFMIYSFPSFVFSYSFTSLLFPSIIIFLHWTLTFVYLSTYPKLNWAWSHPWYFVCRPLKHVSLPCDAFDNLQDNWLWGSLQLFRCCRQGWCLSTFLFPCNFLGVVLKV